MNHAALHSPVTIRCARLADASALASLATQLGYPSTSMDVERRLASVENDPQNLILTAELNGQVVGWAHAFVCCLLESDTFVELGGLVVDERHRGARIGKLLLARVEEWARERNIHTVTLRSNVIRSQAHQFYQAHGYKQIKTQHTFRKHLE